MMVNVFFLSPNISYSADALKLAVRPTILIALNNHEAG